MAAHAHRRNHQHDYSLATTTFTPLKKKPDSTQLNLSWPETVFPEVQFACCSASLVLGLDTVYGHDLYV